ncbi:hypothetical protein DITRI_Ditri14bG0143800 [Diplodiscus trichospermus]
MASSPLTVNPCAGSSAASAINTVTSLGVAGSSSVVPLVQQSHLQPGGSLQDHSASYLRLPTSPYGMAGSSPAGNPYLGSSAASVINTVASLGVAGSTLVVPPVHQSHLQPAGSPPTVNPYAGSSVASTINTVASLGVAGSSSVVPPVQQSHLQPAGSLQDHPALYLRSPADPYGIGMAGSSLAGNPYLGSSAAAVSNMVASLGVAGSSSVVPSVQQFHLQPAGLL